MKKTYYGLLITHVEGPIGPLCKKVVIDSEWGTVTYCVMDILPEKKDEVFDLYIRDLEKDNYWWEEY